MKAIIVLQGLRAPMILQSFAVWDTCARKDHTKKQHALVITIKIWMAKQVASNVLQAMSALKLQLNSVVSTTTAQEDRARPDARADTTLTYLMPFQAVIARDVYLDITVTSQILLCPTQRL